MESNKNDWKLGEIATLSRMEKELKKSFLNLYVRYIGSRYICIREASDSQRGILLKVLGKSYSDQMKIVNGEPFGMDEREEIFDGTCYYSYPFPSVSELKEVLDILRGNRSLLQKFDEAKMHVNPDSMFWVRETNRNAFLSKIPQVYSGRDGQLHNPSDDANYYRVSIVYFFKDQLFWCHSEGM